MNTVLVVGAGFSHAIAQSMPLTKELAGSVCPKDVEDYDRLIYDEITDGESLERYLSSLAEPQPYFDPVRNHENAARFLVAVRQIRDVISSGQSEAESGPLPEWLGKLVRFLHATRSSVVTFNYDTLLECATTTVLRSELQRPGLLPNFYAQRVPQMNPITPGLVYGPDLEPTFRLMKLHGSLDTYWAPGDRSGLSIERVAPRPWAQHPDPMTWDSDLTPAGREPFIVPPSSSKSGFYGNLITQQLWRDAYTSLQQAERVCIVGYSLPLTDLTIGGMLHSALHTCERHIGNVKEIQVVDPYPEGIVTRLAALGLAREIIHPMTIRPEGTRALGDWVDALVGDSDITVYPRA